MFSAYHSEPHVGSELQPWAFPGQLSDCDCDQPGDPVEHVQSQVQRPHQPDIMGLENLCSLADESFSKWWVSQSSRLETGSQGEFQREGKKECSAMSQD